VRILVVNYFYPPVPSNSARWLAMGRHLRARGHEVGVLTTGAFGTHPDDAAHGVVRTHDAVSHPALRTLLRRPPLTAPDDSVPVEKPPPGLLTKVVVPDMYLATWGPWAIRAAHRLIRERHIDIVVTSTPVESGAVVGRILSKRVAWLNDLRDPWTFESLRPEFPTKAQRALDARLERWALTGADAVTAVQETSAHDLQTRLGVPAVRIPNGLDPEVVPAPGPPAIPVEPGTFRIVHTGMLGGAWGRDPRPFLEAVRRVAGERPGLRLVLSGRLTADETRLLADAPYLQHAGQLPRAEAIALQRSADLLVAIGSHRTTEAPGKVLEYLGAEAPILVLGPSTESARIVEETGTGESVAPDDPAAIAAAIERAMRGELRGRGRDPRSVEPYTYPAPAVAMEAQLEQARIRAAARGVRGSSA
jgi:glycosyltransferase involved in cell wall biosynthesis